MKGSHEPRSSSSCAACKLLKRRCTATCIFAPYFRSDEPKKFAKVHKVFGASNVSKILIEVPEEQREDTVNSLAYEAEARLQDPVYGCIGAIALLQRRMAELQRDLAIARARLSRIAAAAAAAAAANNNNSGGSLSCSSSYGVFDGRVCEVGLSGVVLTSGDGFYGGQNSLEFGHTATNGGSGSGGGGAMYDYGFVPYIL